MSCCLLFWHMSKHPFLTHETYVFATGYINWTQTVSLQSAPDNIRVIYKSPHDKPASRCSLLRLVFSIILLVFHII